MKKIILFFLLTAFGFTVSAQSELTTVSYQKNDRLAVINEIPFPEKTIMKAIDADMELKGYKGKSSKGFTVYKAVQMAELGVGSYDLYFSADRKSRRNKDNSTLTVMVSTGDENFITAEKNAALIEKLKAYLDNINPMIEAYDLEQQINDQQEEVNKADKKYNNYVDDGQSLEKKKRDIENDIEKNRKDQESQLADLEKQKIILEALKAKRKQ